MAHKSQKLQFEIVAVLGLISLFTHMHIFWIAGLLLALIDLPDFWHAAAQHRRIGREDCGQREPPAEPPAEEAAVAQAAGRRSAPRRLSQSR